ncbi:MAG TPA: M28 family peptidase, partial [Chitinophagaceae bacterium]|nr:M28 family peptidase [Chitinophagaceae bacterium]
VINFDMVGRLDPREKILAIYGYNSIAKVSSFFTPKMENLNIQTDENDMVHITDAGVFAAAQIPALSFTTGTHDDYHKVSDDAKYINYEGMVQIANLLESFLKTINI